MTEPADAARVDSRARRAPSLDKYATIVGAAEVDELGRLARHLKGRRVKMVNATAVGGGVAEILTRLVPLLDEVGLSTRWDVITGDDLFFHVTKAFHNALHGGGFDGPPEWFEVFLATNAENQRRLVFSEDFVVIHDPQPLALVEARASAGGAWVWRCHIDLSRPDEKVWGFLRPFVERYDAALFSSPAFTHGLAIPQFLFFPAIDPLSDKNRELAPEEVRAVVTRLGVDPDRPILTQVSRFDRLKDPVGVIQAYRLVKKYVDCQLVLAGGAADDDPEGAAVLREVQEAADGDPDIHVVNLPPWSALEINALQRGSTIVIQKSLREGFGLTVSEALWKKRPVVASAVGGIPSQVIHKLTGMLVHSVEGCAYQLRYLLTNPDVARRLGENGHEHVKANFLVTHALRRYLLLFLACLEHGCGGEAEPGRPSA